ncbi:MAG: hypothetical protein HC799_17460 [Limnothrix sp. RL_2_0]|nr:hypothetical protein [Limnothrix sp. RL_2_0]
MEADHVWKDWGMVALLWSISLGCLSGNSLDFQRFKHLRWALSGMAAVSAGLGVAKARQIDVRSPYLAQREVMRNDLFIETQAVQLPSMQPKKQQAALMAANGENGGDRLRHFDVQSFLGEVVGIGILGNSGAGKTTLAQYIANAVGAAQILVLDPHADPEDEHYPWGELTVISDKPKILKQLKLLLKLLDDKDRTPAVIICDEYPAIRAYANKVGSDVADEFILRYGSEARKFKKLPIFLSQSGNVKSLGLDGQGDFLENFALIRLQKIARKYLKTSPDRELYELSKAIAYPMLIGDDELVIHPTHGQYQQSRKELPPQNLKPLVSLPITIPLVGGDRPINLLKSDDAHSTPIAQQRTQLESLLGLACTDTQAAHDNLISCPQCDSNNVRTNGTTSSGKTRYRCNDCGKSWS